LSLSETLFGGKGGGWYLPSAFTTKAHIARVTLEAVCFQMRGVRARTGSTT